MRIAISTFGSEGDFRPFAALGRGLLEAGHQAYLVAPEMFRARTVEAQVPFCASAPAWDMEAMRADLQGVMRERNPLWQSKRDRNSTSAIKMNTAPCSRNSGVSQPPHRETARKPGAPGKSWAWRLARKRGAGSIKPSRSAGVGREEPESAPGARSRSWLLQQHDEDDPSLDRIIALGQRTSRENILHRR